MRTELRQKAEWLEADGLGGFASGTVAGPRTRRYHALLLAATTPPTGRVVLVNGLDASLETDAGTFALSSQRYTPDVVHPDGARWIRSFTPDPWPLWTFGLPRKEAPEAQGSSFPEALLEIEQELFVPHGASVVVVSWRIAAGALSPERAVLSVRPFLSGRDYHSLHHENPAFRFEPEASEGPARRVWRPYHPGIPGIVALSNGTYAHSPDWYRGFLYEEERARGLDDVEDLASPGVFSWDLSKGEALLVFATEGLAGGLLPPGEQVEACVCRLRAAERRRRAAFPSRLHRSADAYLVRRGAGRTIVAGYPWFTDWGRDTFIALRGLCLATGRLDAARDILVEWSSAVSEGMLPNLFPDGTAPPEFNSVDVSLWYVVAVHEFLEATRVSGGMIPPAERTSLARTVEEILEGYSRGTRFGIRMDADGLLASGQPGVQLTWMDAKDGDWVVTPRIGKPVEVQALWLNALAIGSLLSERPGRWKVIFERGRQSFRDRFWNDEGGYLHDVVDTGHKPGTADPTFRPNQIFAVGGLPFPMLEGERALRVVEAVERRLLTPLGPRSLAPGEPGYCPRYEGGPRQRDGAYHQGTVWPWLMGPFVEAWVRVRGGTAEAKQQARERFLEPLLRHLDEAGLGHISEIADAEPPHQPRGCPFQAWSLGEALRLDKIVLSAGAREESRTARAASSRKR